MPSSQIIAEVAGEQITVKELTDAILRSKENYPETHLKDHANFARIKEKTLEDLIHTKILGLEAEKEDVNLSEKELEAHLNRLKSGFSEKDFQKTLLDRGIDYHAWKALKKEKLLIQKLIKKKGLGDVEISSEEQKQYYESHKDEWSLAESVRVRQIVTDTKEKAEHIYERLTRGENFVRLAHALSISPEKDKGGDLGFIQKGSFPKVFDLCFTMNPGEISPIIPSEYGFHIFKVIAKKEAQVKTFTEVESLIQNRLTALKRKEKFDEYLAELEKTYHPKIHQEILAKVRL